MEEALQGTACSLILSCVLEIKTVLQEGITGFPELKYPAGFMVKNLSYLIQNCLRRRKYCSYRAELCCGFRGKAFDLFF